jgi:microcystin degradation protein MlrC
MSRPIRIAVLFFAHETVTFLANDTTLADFTYPGSPASGEALLAHDPKGYMGGFVKVAREYEGVELVGIESPLWPKTGTGSGWITQEAYETFLGKMIADLEAGGPWDGVYLSLHGAMGVRGVPKPEADIARRVREVVGRKAFIVGTFDPHGNEDEEFLAAADMAFCVKYFPHYDSHLQGQRAARMLVRAIRGDYTPVTVTQKVPIITATVLQWTGASPWMDMIQRAMIWEAREPDVYVNCFFGFPFADVPDVGLTFEVMTNGNAKLARHIADDMAAWAWRRREALLNTAKVHLIPAGVTLAKQAIAQGATPVVLADHSDRSGYATWILKEAIEQGLERVLFATIADGRLSRELEAKAAKAGDAFDHEVGGLADESAGQPVRIQGTIVRVVKHGAEPWYVIEFGSKNVLILSRYLVQIQEPLPLNDVVGDVSKFNAIAIKSRVHFRRGFDDSGFAPTILLVEPIEPFLGTVRLDGLPYKNVDLKKFYPYADVKFP